MTERDREHRPRRRLGQAARRAPIVTTADDEHPAPSVTEIGRPLTRSHPRHRLSAQHDPLLARGSWDSAVQHRRRRRQHPRDRALLILGLLSLPLAVIWIIVGRPGIGPVLVRLTPGHGLHAFDLVLLLVATPIWCGLAIRARRWRRRRRHRRHVR